MKGEALPDPDHVARYVGGSQVHNGRMVGNAFLRRRDESAPSVHWLEILGGNIADQIVGVRPLSRLTPGAKAVFARLNVGRTKAHVAENDTNNHQIAFIHDPREPKPPDYPLADPSHALIEGLPNPDDTPEAEAIGDLISQTVLDTFPASTSTDPAV